MRQDFSHEIDSDSAYVPAPIPADELALTRTADAEADQDIVRRTPVGVCSSESKVLPQICLAIAAVSALLIMVATVLSAWWDFSVPAQDITVDVGLWKICVMKNKNYSTGCINFSCDESATPDVCRRLYLLRAMMVIASIFAFVAFFWILPLSIPKFACVSFQRKVPYALRTGGRLSKAAGLMFGLVCFFLAISLITAPGMCDDMRPYAAAYFDGAVFDVDTYFCFYLAIVSISISAVAMFVITFYTWFLAVPAPLKAQSVLS